MDLIVFLHIGLAVWLFHYFATHDKGSKEPKGAMRMACAMGVVAVLIAGEVNTWLLPDVLQAFLDGQGPQPDNGVILGGALMVGVIEETLKFLPLALIIYKKRYFDEITDGIIYFGLCGMWFGAIESITYALSYGQSVGITRLIVGPFLHAAFSALAGWGLARHKMLRTTLAVPFMFYVAAILVHGFYDFGLFTGNVGLSLVSLVMAVASNVGLFILFKRAQKQDEALGLSAIGTNNFCRHCGRPNRENHLFCMFCGRKA